MNRGEILAKAGDLVGAAFGELDKRGDGADTDDKLAAAAMGLLYVTASSLNSIASSLVKIAAKK